MIETPNPGSELRRISLAAEGIQFSNKECAVKLLTGSVKLKHVAQWYNDIAQVKSDYGRKGAQVVVWWGDDDEQSAPGTTEFQVP